MNGGGRCSATYLPAALRILVLFFRRIPHCRPLLALSGCEGLKEFGPGTEGFMALGGRLSCSASFFGRSMGHGPDRTMSCFLDGQTGSWEGA